MEGPKNLKIGRKEDLWHGNLWLHLNPKVGVAWLTWLNFEILWPLNISKTDKARLLKFGTCRLFPTEHCLPGNGRDWGVQWCPTWDEYRCSTDYLQGQGHIVSDTSVAAQLVYCCPTILCN